LKTGGRRIAYSASKKGFLYPLETRQKSGFSLDINALGEDGSSSDATRVCQIGECEEHLDEITKELLPKLASRLETEGYVSLRWIGWPTGRELRSPPASTQTGSVHENHCCRCARVFLLRFEPRAR
jgi:hypothetical protein